MGEIASKMEFGGVGGQRRSGPGIIENAREEERRVSFTKHGGAQYLPAACIPDFDAQRVALYALHLDGLVPDRRVCPPPHTRLERLVRC